MKAVLCIGWNGKLKTCHAIHGWPGAGCETKVQKPCT